MTDLTDRMRTCAAFILSCESDVVERAIRDAADLLIEASNALESAAETMERGAYDLRDGGYLRSATILEEEAGKMKGEPMEIIPPVPDALSDELKRKIEQIVTDAGGTWVAAGDTLPVANPYRSAHACPKCDSRAGKTVRIKGNFVWLECPVCGHIWKKCQ